MLIDGQSVAFLSTGGNALGPELIPLSAIERVEIIRGPASALYGADAFLGLVNIQTRSGRSLNGLSGSVAGGWTGGKPAADVDLSLGTSRGPVDVLLAYRQTEQNLGDLDMPVTTPGSPPVLGQPATTPGPEQATTSALAKVVYRPIATGALTLFAHRLSWDRGLPDGDRVDQWQFRSGLQWDQDIGQSLRLSVVGAYCQGATGDDNRLEVGSEFYFVRRRFGYRCLESDGHVAWTPLSRLRLVTGASLLVDDEQLPSRIGVVKQPIEGALPGDTLDAISIAQGRKTFVNAGAYLQGTWDIVRNLLGVTGGLRYDQHNIYGGQLSRRLGLVSSPRPNLHAKLLHGTAFKAPSPLLLYAVPSSSGDVVGNQDLAPAVREHVRVPAGLRADRDAQPVDGRRLQRGQRQDGVRPAGDQQGGPQRGPGGHAVLGEPDRVQVPQTGSGPTPAWSCSGPSSAPGRRATPLRSSGQRAASTRG